MTDNIELLNDTDYDIGIIGGGVAGMTAAIYCARAGKRVIIFDGNGYGGQVLNARNIENFPSYLSIDGPQLAEQMYEQMEKYENIAIMESDYVEEIYKGDEEYVIEDSFGGIDHVKSIIFANGSTHKELNIPGKEKLNYCALCEGPFYKDKTVCVVGDGNTAVQYALYLAEICKKVVLVTLTNELFCEDILIDKVKYNAKIDWHRCSFVSEICTDNPSDIKNSNVTSIISNVILGENLYASNKIQVDGVFVAIGQVPDNENFKKLVNLDDKGYIITDENMRTSAEGVFACGDTRRKTVRQITTAVGDATIAATNAINYLNTIK